MYYNWIINLFKLITYIILISCNGQETPNKIPFSKQIPILENGKQDPAYILIKEKTLQLDLEILENGFDSLQIRIWYEYSLIPHRDLIILSYNGFQWKGFHYTMKIDWVSEPQEIISQSKATEIIPLSGWSLFIEELLNNEITSLPDMHEIEGLSDGYFDGISYNIEIATVNSYRVYSYHEPEQFKQFQEAELMIESLELIQREFGINYKFKEVNK